MLLLATSVVVSPVGALVVNVTPITVMFHMEPVCAVEKLVDKLQKSDNLVSVDGTGRNTTGNPETKD